MIANILPTEPPSHDPKDGVKRPNSTFSEHGHIASQIEVNHECSKIVANNSPADPAPHLHPPEPGVGAIGSKGQNSTLSEHSHVAYQIKGNHECSNMVANILPQNPNPLNGVKRSKFNFFRTLSYFIPN